MASQEMDGASTPSQPPPSPDIPLADLTRIQLVQIYNLSDREAWNYSDEVLCASHECSNISCEDGGGFLAWNTAVVGCRRTVRNARWEGEY
ncbi:unnamed protein product [Rhizoctonia solani]|uniref:Uncharacterized protein n=1 Tax=Rhizoctonia solani TaxID=456999 RepID=A0A8H3DLI7_9AGAM|nr:unnamed protein product [Rhizoctonia solani]